MVLEYFWSGYTASKYFCCFFTVDACPAPTAIGAPSSGKLTTIQTIAKILGCNIESQATFKVIQRLISKTTIPLCWDDPTHPSSVKQLLTGEPREKERKFCLPMLCWQ